MQQSGRLVNMILSRHIQQLQRSDGVESAAFGERILGLGGVVARDVVAFAVLGDAFDLDEGVAPVEFEEAIT